MKFVVVDLEVFLRNPKISVVSSAPNSVRSQRFSLYHIVTEIFFINDQCVITLTWNVSQMESLISVDVNRSNDVLTSHWEFSSRNKYDWDNTKAYLLQLQCRMPKLIRNWSWKECHMRYPKITMRQKDREWRRSFWFQGRIGESIFFRRLIAGSWWHINQDDARHS